MDIIETGYIYSKTNVPDKLNITYKMAVGTDYYSTFFFDFRSRILKKIDFSKRIGLRSLT